MKNSTLLLILFFTAPFLMAQNCVIENLHTEIASDCYDDGTFDAHLEFDIENGNNSGFDVYVNNEFFQYFPEYPDPFVSLLNVFEGNGSELLIRVQDNDNPECFATTFLTLPDCPGSCSLDDLTVEFIECNLVTGNYTAFVNYNHEYQIFTQLKIYLNDEFYTNWNTNFEMPQIFQFEGASSPDQIDVLKICTNDTQQCCTEFEFQPPNCTTNECIIDELFLEERTGCNADGQFYIFPGFTSVNLSDNVNIYINGEDQGQFSSESFNYEIGPFDGNGSFYEIKICDAIDENCCKTDTIGPLFCEPNDFCFIGNLEIEKECLSTGNFSLQVMFEHGFTTGMVNISSDQFDYGTFNVNDQPIILGPTAEVFAPEYIYVVDVANSDCGVIEELNFEACPDVSCNINIISASKFCDGANDFIVLDYIHENTIDAVTLFYVNDVLIGSNDEINSEVTLTLSDLPTPIDNTFTIEVINEGFNQCQDEITLCGVSGCDFNCSIDELYVEEECIGDGNFYVYVYASSSFGMEEVGLSGNGNDYGSYIFSDQPFEVGPFTAKDLVDEIIITAGIDSLCQSCIQFDAIDCGPGICEISDLEIYDLFCDSLGLTYSMEIDFESQHVGPTYTVRVNGVDHGIFSSSDKPPINLFNIEPRSNSNSDIIEICATNVEDCCLVYEYLPPPDCANDDCYIDILGAEVICDGPVVYIELAYNYLNPFSEAHFYVNGELYSESTEVGQFLGIQLGPVPSNPDGFYNITVLDAEQENCIAEISLDDFCFDCTIGAVQAEQECLNDSLYYVYVTFEYGFNTTQVQIIGNGQNHGIYNAFDQPIEIGPFTSSDLINEFVVIDLLNPDCQGETILEVEDCGDDGECNIDILGAEILCDGSVVYIEMAYNYLNPFSEAHFYVNGELYAQSAEVGQFLGIQLGPIPSNPNGVFEVTVIDAEQDNCFAELSLDNYCSDDCFIGEVQAIQECLNDSSYFVYVTFEFGFNTTMVQIVGNGEDYGRYDAFEQPIELGPFTTADVINEFLVFDTQYPDCQSEAIFLEEDCGDDGECNIDILGAEILCDGPVVYIELAYTYLNPFSEAHFYVNGELYAQSAEVGQFLGIQLGPIPANPDGFYNITVLDAEQEDCIAEIVLDDFCTEDCFIENIQAEQDCLADGTYLVHLFYNHSNTSGAVIVRGNGQLYGTFEVDEPIILGPFSDSDIVNEFVVIDAQMEDCNSFVEVAFDDCETLSGCGISDLIIDVVSCDESTGTYNMVVNFNHQTVNATSFDVWVNNEFYDQFSFDEYPPFVVENVFPRPNSEYDIIQICYSDSIDCCEILEYMQPDCIGTDECDISNLVIDHDCLDDGIYYLYVSFDHLNTSEFVTIQGNGNNYGDFNVFEQPIQLGPFPSGEIINELVVFDVNLECRDVIEFDPIECEETGPCEIGTPDVQIECNPDGTFYAYLTTSYANISNFVNIRGNGVNYGAFNVDKQPFKIGPLAGDGTTFYEFVVIDSENEDCRNFVEYGVVACEEEEGCAIFNVNILEVECDQATNTYNALIDFSFINPTNDFFDVWVNNEFYDFFSFGNQPPFEIINISPRENSEYDIIVICMNDNPECCVEYEFIQPSCLETSNSGDEPEVIDLEVETLDCNESNGTYSIRVDFDTENYAGTSFNLWVNGTLLPSVSLTEVPVIYTGITPQANTTVDVIKLCIGEDDETCVEMEYDQPDCLNTSIDQAEIFGKVKLYPNPADNFINLVNLPNSTSNIEVIDNLGRQRFMTSTDLNRINVTNLEKGIYFVKVVTKDNYFHSFKFIKN